MIALSCKDAAVVVGGKVTGANVRFSGVSTDTRNISQGNLFVAIKGLRFDGHDFVSQAQAAGATAVLIHRVVTTTLPQILVSDTRLALGRLAAAWRQRFAIQVVGVTGSNGKTTTKEMIAAILGRLGKVLATQGNLNNDIGVPLTLVGLNDMHRYAVVEMGANHAGEIAYMADLVRPDVAVVTNAGAAHLEGFGDLQGVARAKGELFQSLAADGTAILNRDDVFAPLWLQLIGKRRILSFGLQSDADFTLRLASERMEFGTNLNSIFTMVLPSGEVDIHLPLVGQHSLVNACAAAAAAWALGAGRGDIQQGLRNLVGIKGRLQLKMAGSGLRILDDTYNANPSSVRAALEVLAKVPGEKVLVLGDMGELGVDAEQLHAELGQAARDMGVSRLYTLGDLSRRTAERYGVSARHFAHQPDLIAALYAELPATSTVLVKGSRHMQMEKVVAALLADRSKE